MRNPWGLRSALAFGLAGGLAGGLVGGLANGLANGLAVGLAGGLAFGLAFGLAVGLERWFDLGWELAAIDPRDTQYPNEGIHRSLRNALRAALPLLSLAALAALGAVLSGNQLLFLGIFFIWFAYSNAESNGLDACLRHLALRATLRRAGYAPPGYVRFLQTMCRLQLLRRRGGGFSFYHLELRDHLAAQWVAQHTMPRNGSSRPLGQPPVPRDLEPASSQRRGDSV